MPLDPARVRFTCQPGCVNCCDQRGYVYLTEADLLRAAKFVGMEPAAFEARYVFRTRRFLRLRKPPKSQCHFLMGHGCSIHPAKPTQCRTFPFWPDLIENEDEWLETARYCPGIGVGGFVPLETVQRSLAEMRAAKRYLENTDVRHRSLLGSPVLSIMGTLRLPDQRSRTRIPRGETSGRRHGNREGCER